MVRKPRNMKPIILLLGVLLLLPAVAGPFSPVSAMFRENNPQDQTVPADGAAEADGAETVPAKVDPLAEITDEQAAELEAKLGDEPADQADQTDQADQADPASDLPGDPADENATDDEPAVNESEGLGVTGVTPGDSANLRLLILNNGRSDSIYGGSNKSYMPGDYVNVSVYVENQNKLNGDPTGDAGDATVTMNFPDWLTPVSAENNGSHEDLSGGFSAESNGGRFVWNVGDVPAGTAINVGPNSNLFSAFVRFTVNTNVYDDNGWISYPDPTSAVFTMNGTVSAAVNNGCDGANGGCASSDTFSLLQPTLGASNLDTNGGSTYAGQQKTITYTHVISAPPSIDYVSGSTPDVYLPLPASSAHVTVPAGFDVVSVALTGADPTVTYTQYGPRLFQIDDPGGVRTQAGTRTSTLSVEVVPTITSGSRMFSLYSWIPQASLDLCCFTPFYGNLSDNQYVEVKPPALYPNISGELFAGKNSELTAKILNGSPAPSGVVTSVVTLPVGATLVATNPVPGTVADNGNGTVTWTIPNIGPLGEAVLDLTVKMPGSSKDTVWQSKIAVTSGQTVIQNGYCNWGVLASCTSGEVQFDGYTQDLTVNKPTSFEGDYLTYTMTVTNFGCEPGGPGGQGVTAGAPPDDCCPPEGPGELLRSLAHGTSGSRSEPPSTRGARASMGPEPEEVMFGQGCEIGSSGATQSNVRGGVASAMTTGSDDLYAINTLPPGVTYTGTWHADQGTIVDNGGGVLRWNIGSMAQGTTLTATVEVLVTNGAPNELLDRFQLFDPELDQPILVFNECDDDPEQSCALTVLGDSTQFVQDKFVDKANAQVGDTLTYTIAATNQGDDFTDNVFITDILPSGVTFVSASHGGEAFPCVPLPPPVGQPPAACDYSFAEWELTGGFDAGETVEVTVTVTINAGLATPTTLENRAYVYDTSTPDWVSAPAGDTACLDDAYGSCAYTNVGGPVVDDPALTFGKSVDKTTAGAGDTLIYTLTARNTSGVPATNFVGSDTLPAGVTFVSATATNGTATNNAGVVTWNVGSLAAGATASAQVVVKVDAGEWGADLTNRFGATCTDCEPPVVQNPCVDAPGKSCVTTNVATPTWEQNKTVDLSAASPGDSLTYSVSAVNTGPVPVPAFTLTDVLPPQVIFVSASGGGSYNATNRTITWAVTGIAEAGSVDYTVVATVADDAYDVTFSNRLKSTPPPNFPPPVVENPCEDDPTATCAPVTTSSSPGFAYGKTVDATNAVPGDELTYTLTASNFGDGPGDLVADDNLPDGVTFVSATATTGTVTHANGVVTWTALNVAPGVAATATIIVTVDAGEWDATLTNRLKVTCDDCEPPVVENPCVDDPTQSCVTTETPLPAWTQNKTVDLESASPGDTLTYTVTATNTGTVPVPAFTLTDVLPDEMTFVSATGGGAYNPADRTITWNPSGIAVGDTLTYTVIATVNDDAYETTFSNRLKTSPPPNFPPPTVENPCEDDPTATCAPTTTSSAPKLAYGKTVDATNAVPGDDLTYTLTASNIGNGPGDLVAVDTLPNGVTFASATATNGTVTNTNGVVTWTVEDLTPGQVATATIIVTVDAGEWDATLTNRLKVTCDDCEPPVVENPCVDDPTQSCVTTETPLPAWTQNKTVDIAAAAPGDDLTYTVTATNTGTVPVPAFTLTDEIPEEVTFVSATGNPVDFAGSLVWDVDGLAVGETKTFTVNVKVVDDASNVTFSNRLKASPPPNFPPPTVENPCEDDPTATCAPTTVTSGPQLAYGKTVDLDQAFPGDELTYTLTATNVGNGQGSELTATDTLPEGVTVKSLTASTGTIVNNGDGTITWSIGSLAPDQVVSAKIVVTIGDGQWDNGITNRFGVTNNPEDCVGYCPPPVVENPCDDNPGESCVTTTIPDPAMVLSKVARSSEVRPGDRITYDIVVENTGDFDFTGVTVRDIVPPELNIEGADFDGGTFDEATRTISWPVDRLDIGEKATFVVSFIVAEDAQTGMFENRVVVETPPDFPPPTIEYQCSDDPNASCAPAEIVDDPPVTTTTSTTTSTSTTTTVPGEPTTTTTSTVPPTVPGGPTTTAPPTTTTSVPEIPVNVPSVPSPPSHPIPYLPVTGAEFAGLLMAAITLIGGGFFLIATTRRRNGLAGEPEGPGEDNDE